MAEEKERRADNTDDTTHVYGDHQLCDLVARIQARMTSSLQALLATEGAPAVAKEAAVGMYRNLDMKLWNSTRKSLQEIEKHVTDRKSSLTTGIERLRSLIERSTVVRQMTFGPDKQKRIDELETDLKTQEQCQQLPVLCIDFQPSPLSRQMLTNGVSMGKVNIRALNSSYQTGTSPQEVNIDQEVTSDNAIKIAYPNGTQGTRPKGASEGRQRAENNLVNPNQQSEINSQGELNQQSIIYIRGNLNQLSEISTPVNSQGKLNQQSEIYMPINNQRKLNQLTATPINSQDKLNQLTGTATPINSQGKLNQQSEIANVITNIADSTRSLEDLPDPITCQNNLNKQSEIPNLMTHGTRSPIPHGVSPINHNHRVISNKSSGCSQASLSCPYMLNKDTGAECARPSEHRCLCRRNGGHLTVVENCDLSCPNNCTEEMTLTGQTDLSFLLCSSKTSYLQLETSCRYGVVEEDKRFLCNKPTENKALGINDQSYDSLFLSSKHTENAPVALNNRPNCSCAHAKNHRESELKKKNDRHHSLEHFKTTNCNPVQGNTTLQGKSGKSECSLTQEKETEELASLFDADDHKPVGCGFVYRDEWRPNIVCGPRSIEEMSFNWSQTMSETSSLCNNCAYPHDTNNEDTQNTTEIKELNNVTESNGNELGIKRITRSNQGLKRVDGHSSDLAVANKFEAKSLLCRFSSTFETNQHRNSCVIHDITWLRNNRILLTDHYHNNIQLFDENFNCITEEACPYPMGACSVDKVRDVAAVSLRRTGSIAIFKAKHNRLKRLRVIKVKCEYYIWNVVYRSDRLFVICDENNVHILDLNGKQYGVINLGIPTEFGYIRNYDVSEDGKLLYLCTERGIVCVNKDGDQLWRFTMNDVPGSQMDRYGKVLESVCLFEDRLLAAQWTRNIILEISLDGKYVKHLVTDGLEHPRAMVVRNGRLAVTQFNPTMKENKKRTVKIFDMVLT